MFLAERAMGLWRVVTVMRRIECRDQDRAKFKAPAETRAVGEGQQAPEVPEAGPNDRRAMLPVQGVARKRIGVGDAPLVVRNPGRHWTGCGALRGTRRTTVGCCRGLES